MKYVFGRGRRGKFWVETYYPETKTFSVTEEDQIHQNLLLSTTDIPVLRNFHEKEFSEIVPECPICYQLIYVEWPEAVTSGTELKIVNLFGHWYKNQELDPVLFDFEQLKKVPEGLLANFSPFDKPILHNIKKDALLFRHNSKHLNKYFHDQKMTSASLIQINQLVPKNQLKDFVTWTPLVTISNWVSDLLEKKRNHNDKELTFDINELRKICFYYPQEIFSISRMKEEEMLLLELDDLKIQDYLKSLKSYGTEIKRFLGVWISQKTSSWVLVCANSNINILFIIEKWQDSKEKSALSSNLDRKIEAFGSVINQFFTEKAADNPYDQQPFYQIRTTLDTQKDNLNENVLGQVSFYILLFLSPLEWIYKLGKFQFYFPPSLNIPFKQAIENVSMEILQRDREMKQKIIPFKRNWEVKLKPQATNVVNLTLLFTAKQINIPQGEIILRQHYGFQDFMSRLLSTSLPPLNKYSHAAERAIQWLENEDKNLQTININRIQSIKIPYEKNYSEINQHYLMKFWDHPQETLKKIVQHGIPKRNEWRDRFLLFVKSFASLPENRSYVNQFFSYVPYLVPLNTVMEHSLKLYSKEKHRGLLGLSIHQSKSPKALPEKRAAIVLIGEFHDNDREEQDVMRVYELSTILSTWFRTFPNHIFHVFLEIPHLSQSISQSEQESKEAKEEKDQEIIFDLEQIERNRFGPLGGTQNLLIKCLSLKKKGCNFPNVYAHYIDTRTSRDIPSNKIIEGNWGTYLDEFTTLLDNLRDGKQSYDQTVIKHFLEELINEENDQLDEKQMHFIYDLIVDEIVSLPRFRKSWEKLKTKEREVPERVILALPEKFEEFVRDLILWDPYLTPPTFSYDDLKIELDTLASSDPSYFLFSDSWDHLLDWIMALHMLYIDTYALLRILFYSAEENTTTFVITGDVHRSKYEMIINKLQRKRLGWKIHKDYSNYTYFVPQIERELKNKSLLDVGQILGFFLS
jgi:hypothetical protein